MQTRQTVITTAARKCKLRRRVMQAGQADTAASRSDGLPDAFGQHTDGVNYLLRFVELHVLFLPPHIETQHEEDED